MAVPEGAVDKHGDAAARPGNVGTASYVTIVTSPASHPGGGEGSPESHLRGSVLAPDGRHDAAPVFGRPRVGHVRVLDFRRAAYRTALAGRAGDNHVQERKPDQERARRRT